MCIRDSACCAKLALMYPSFQRCTRTSFGSSAPVALADVTEHGSVWAQSGGIGADFAAGQSVDSHWQR
eukprot:13775977-Alexandrium_andersonii.AAC.1